MHWSELKVWKHAHALVLEIYKISASFPAEELYGITSQIRRASVSIPSNIVEGQSRNSTKEYLNFLHISRGSLEETRYLLLLSRDLEYLPSKEHERIEKITKETSKMLNGLIASLKT